VVYQDYAGCVNYNGLGTQEGRPKARSSPDLSKSAAHTSLMGATWPVRLRKLELRRLLALPQLAPQDGSQHITVEKITACKSSRTPDSELSTT
jgi:hypothetical protein